MRDFEKKKKTYRHLIKIARFLSELENKYYTVHMHIVRSFVFSSEFIFARNKHSLDEILLERSFVHCSAGSQLDQANLTTKTYLFGPFV